MEIELEHIYEKALEECNKGKVPEELKILYNSPYRNQIDWSRFPFWAIPNAETEGCHEG